MTDKRVLHSRVPAMAITSANADRVSGRIASTGGPNTAMSLGDIVDFADRLAETGAGLGIGPGSIVRQIECHVSLFHSGDAGEVRGEAVPLHRGERTTNWQVTIRDQKGVTLSTVNLTYLLVEASAQFEPADRPEAAVPQDETPPAKSASPAPTQSEKRREHIAAAASDVIARKGFANATMREIADAAGMHVPTMYQYVASKDEMLELVYNWTMAIVRTDVAAASVNCVTATEKLRATIGSIVDKGDRYRHGIGVLNRELRSLSPQARVRVLAEYRRLILQIVELVNEGVASGEFRPVEPEIASNLVDAACDIWPLRQFAVRQFGLETFRREITELLVRSLQA